MLEFLIIIPACNVYSWSWISYYAWNGHISCQLNILYWCQSSSLQPSREKMAHLSIILTNEQQKWKSRINEISKWCQVGCASQSTTRCPFFFSLRRTQLLMINWWTVGKFWEHFQLQVYKSASQSAIHHFFIIQIIWLNNFVLSLSFFFLIQSQPLTMQSRRMAAKKLLSRLALASLAL